MARFLGFVITGGVSGALYSMMATGLTLSYTTTGLFNFSHAALAFACAYTFYELDVAVEMPTAVAALLTILVFAPLLGIALDAFAFRKLSAAPEQVRILGTVGLSIAIPAAVLWILTELVNVFGLDLLLPGQGAIPRSVGPSPANSWEILPRVTLNSDQLCVFGFAAVTAIVVWLVVRHTRIGLEMRAAVESRPLAELRGVRLGRVSRAAWVLSTMCAAMVGVVGGWVLGLGTGNYTMLLVASAAAMTLGAMRSIPLAFVGGLALGIAQSLVAGYLNRGILDDIPGLSASVPFVLLLAGLVVLGKNRSRTAGTSTSIGSAMLTLRSEQGWRHLLPGMVALAATLGFTLFLANDYWVAIMAQGFIMSVIFLSFVVVTGMGGMVSLAQAGFVTTAALLGGFLMGEYGMALLPALLVGVAATALFGAVTALPAMRLNGVALGLATLAVVLLLDQVIFQIPEFNNNSAGWSYDRPQIGGFEIRTDKAFAVFALAVAAVFLVLIRNFERSATGRALLAVRGASVSATTSGVNVVRVKLIAFTFSAVIAGVGGLLLASFNGSVSQGTTPPLQGLLWITVAVTFGVRRPSGAIAAGIVTAAFPPVLQWYTTSTYIPAMLFGLGAVALADNPDGVVAQTMDNLRNVRRWLRRRLRPAEAAPAAVRVAATTEQPTQNVLLRLEGTVAGYGALEVLHAVDLAVPTGSITVVVGANGAGKSTLCGVVAGLLPTRRGSIVFDGDAVQGWTAAKRAEAGCFLAPESRGIFPGLTVDDNLAVWLQSAAERDEAYDRFPLLAARREAAASSLSGGEQQILALAPAFVRVPRLLVVDEPTLGLAPLIRQQVMDLCRTLRDTGVTILLVEEKAREVLEVADRVAVLQLGRVLWDRPRAEVDEHVLLDVFLNSAADRAAQGVPSIAPG